MITFVIHYIHLSEKMIEKVVEARSTYTDKELVIIKNPEAILDAQYHSIKKFHPDAEVVILTDLSTHLKVNPSIKIIRYPMESNWVDYESFKAKTTFLKKTSTKTNIIFLEWDMLVQADLSSIFEGDSDVYFTVHNIFPMPFNDGFIAVKKESILAACQIFDFFLSRYEHFSSYKYRSWYGLQLILKVMFLPAFVKVKTKDYSGLKIIIQDVKIGFLNGSIYNSYPIRSRIQGFYPNKKVVHFAKDNKYAILRYYKEFIKTKK